MLNVSHSNGPAACNMHCHIVRQSIPTCLHTALAASCSACTSAALAQSCLSWGPLMHHRTSNDRK